MELYKVKTKNVPNRRAEYCLQSMFKQPSILKRLSFSVHFKCNAIVKPVASAETVPPKRFIAAQIQGSVGRSVQRQYAIQMVMFLRRGNQPRPFALIVSTEGACLHQEGCTEHEVSGSGSSQVYTAPLDAFGGNAQRV